MHLHFICTYTLTMMDCESLLLDKEVVQASYRMMQHCIHVLRPTGTNK